MFAFRVMRVLLVSVPFVLFAATVAAQETPPEPVEETRTAPQEDAALTETPEVAGDAESKEAAPGASDGSPSTDSAVAPKPLGPDGEGKTATIRKLDWDDPDKLKVAVMDMQGSESIPREFFASLTNTIPQTLEILGPFSAISGQDIHHMLELQKLRDQLGCEDVQECLIEIGGALGADYLINSRVTLVGDVYLLQMQLVTIARARVGARVEREYVGGPKGLLDEVRAATKILVRDVLAEQSGTLALSISEEGATIKIDGNIVGISPMESISLGGGMHTVTIHKDGFVQFVRDVAVSAHQETSLNADLRPSAEFVRGYRESAGFVRNVAWVTLGVGGAGLVASGVLYGVGAGEASDLRKKIRKFKREGSNDKAMHDDIENRNARLGTIDVFTLTTGVVGLVCLGVGSFLYFAGDDPDRYDAVTDMGLEPSVLIVPAPGGVGLAGTF
ncbi:PEGA domain-containing protein [Myxococcota bacterium]